MRYLLAFLDNEAKKRRGRSPDDERDEDYEDFCRRYSNGNPRRFDLDYNDGLIGIRRMSGRRHPELFNEDGTRVPLEQGPYGRFRVRSGYGPDESRVRAARDYSSVDWESNPWRWDRDRHYFSTDSGEGSSATIRERDYEHRNLDNVVRRNYGNGRRYWDRYSQFSDDLSYNDHIDTRYGQSCISNRYEDDRQKDEFDDGYYDRLRCANYGYGNDGSGGRPNYDATYRLYGDATTNNFNKYTLYEDANSRPNFDTRYRLYGDTTTDGFNNYNRFRPYDDGSTLTAYRNNDDHKSAYQGRLCFAEKPCSDDIGAQRNDEYKDRDYGDGRIWDRDYERFDDGYGYRSDYNRGNNYENDSGSRHNDNYSYNGKGNAWTHGYEDDDRRRNYNYEVNKPKAVILKRAIVPDNNCLFNAIGYAISHRRDQGQALRMAIVKIVAEDPENFNEAILGMPNVEYCRWICSPDTWGGGIELEILGDIFHCEIATYNVFTGKLILHAEGKGYKQRILLLYDGKHYDALALAQNRKAPEIIDQTIFPIDEDHTLGDVEPLIKKYFKESLMYWQ